MSTKANRKSLTFPIILFLIFLLSFSLPILFNLDKNLESILFWSEWLVFFIFAYNFKTYLPKDKKPLFYGILGIAGFFVSLYLFIPYTQGEDSSVNACVTGGCDIVKNSPFSHLFGIKHPLLSLPFWGMIFYSFIAIYNFIKAFRPKLTHKIESFVGINLDLLAVVPGFIFSIYLTGLEAFAIHAWCSYCMVQAAISTITFFERSKETLKLRGPQILLFILENTIGVLAVYLTWHFKESLYIAFTPLAIFAIYLISRFPDFIRLGYKWIAKPIFFLFDAEFIHNLFTFSGRISGKIGPLNKVMAYILKTKNPRLIQEHFGHTFFSPIGLAAGFDNNANLAPVLPNIGFGFQSVGTVTNQPCPGNPKPRLGRLPKSKSLLVNKGFKNDGIDKNIKKVQFPKNFPVGISIGATNLPECSTSAAQIKDIIEAFKKVKDDERFAYFELNISCPNVVGSGYLATPDTLTEVLDKITKLKLSRPLIIKFPAEIEWSEAKKLVQIMVKYKVAGIVVCNLIRNREDPDFDPEEIADAGKGNMSGKPVEKYSNELIAKIYKEFGDKIMIVGVGGVMSPEDAYKKIKLGASLIQLISGMILYSPTLMYEINQKLPELLTKDGFENISEAIGSDIKTR